MSFHWHNFKGNWKMNTTVKWPICWFFPTVPHWFTHIFKFLCNSPFSETVSLTTLSLTPYRSSSISLPCFLFCIAMSHYLKVWIPSFTLYLPPLLCRLSHGKGVAHLIHAPAQHLEWCQDILSQWLTRIHC